MADRHRRCRSQLSHPSFHFFHTPRPAFFHSARMFRSSCMFQSCFWPPHCGPSVLLPLQSRYLRALIRSMSCASPWKPWESRAQRQFLCHQSHWSNRELLPHRIYVLPLSVPYEKLDACVTADLAINLVRPSRRPPAQHCEQAGEPDLHPRAVQILVQPTSRDSASLPRIAEQCNRSRCNTASNNVPPMSVCCEKWRPCCLYGSFQYPRRRYHWSGQFKPGPGLGR